MNFWLGFCAGAVFVAIPALQFINGYRSAVRDIANEMRSVVDDCRAALLGEGK